MSFYRGGTVRSIVNGTGMHKHANLGNIGRALLGKTDSATRGAVDTIIGGRLANEGLKDYLIRDAAINTDLGRRLGGLQGALGFGGAGGLIGLDAIGPAGLAMALPAGIAGRFAGEAIGGTSGLLTSPFVSGLKEINRMADRAIVTRR
jgi:hypothetical protein